MKPDFSIFSFVVFVSRVITMKSFPNPRSGKLSLFSYKGFLVFVLTFRPLTNGS